jgi:Tfp pilus assembly protein PilX
MPPKALQQAIARRIRDEEGIALVMALGITVVLIIFVASMISFTSSNGRSARISAADVQALQYAEAGLNTAYSILQNQTVVSGGNPAAANLLGCNGVSAAAPTSGPSDCSAPSPKVVCVTTTGCAAGSAGSASVFGFYSGINTATYNGTQYPAGTWVIVSTGYAPNPTTNTTLAKVETATIPILPLDSGAVAAVWNHIFITSPLVPNQCAVDFGGNGLTIASPLYAIGNVCLSGQNVTVQEVAGGQPVDLMVGGKLVLSGSGTSAGLSTKYLTSGVIVGGCTTVSVSSATSACGTSTRYYVTTPDTYVTTEAPEESDADILNDYNTFDPGPKHGCTGLGSTTFDGDGVQNGTNASFELTPLGSTYSCVSTSGGAATGQLTWNGTTSTWNGVPAKTLVINGNIFFDGNVTISSPATYTGSAVIEAANTITVNGNATTLCATNPCNTATNGWQGSSGNNSMLTLVALKRNATSLSFTDNSQTFQGSIWLQPTSSMTFLKNGVTVEGPISIGKFDNTFNNATFIPLPVIKNMPVGAPIPPNTGASVGAMTVTH